MKNIKFIVILLILAWSSVTGIIYVGTSVYFKTFNCMHWDDFNPGVVIIWAFIMFMLMICAIAAIVYITKTNNDE